MKRWSTALLVCLAFALPCLAWAQLPIRTYLFQNAATANSNGLVAHAAGFSIAGVQVAFPAGATPTVAIHFESSINDAHYTATLCQPIGGVTLVQHTNVIGQWRCNVAGSVWFRSRLSGYIGPGAVTVLGTLLGGEPAIGLAENSPIGSQTVNQGGTWTVQATHQGGQWNIDKVSHVNATMAHVIGTVTVEGRGAAGTPAGGVVSVQGVASGTVVPVSLSNIAVNQSGSWTVQAAHQGGQWNVAHVTSVLHVAGSTTPRLACHSTSGVAQIASAIVAHGSGQFIEICGVVLVNSSATVQNVSLVEGTGAACATGTVGLIGGGSSTVALGANSGSLALASGTPWVRTSVSGNNVCVLQSGTDRIAGTLTYRGVP